MTCRGLRLGRSYARALPLPRDLVARRFWPFLPVDDPSGLARELLECLRAINPAVSAAVGEASISPGQDEKPAASVPVVLNPDISALFGARCDASENADPHHWNSSSMQGYVVVHPRFGCYSRALGEAVTATRTGRSLTNNRRCNNCRAPESMRRLLGDLMANELDRWLKEAIDPTVRGYGFHGGPRRYRRRAGDLVCGLQFQGSDANGAGWWKFTLNYGVKHLGIARVTGFDGPDMWHILRRVGGTTDLWWQVGDGADREAVAVAVIERLRDEVMPFLDAVGTPAGFEVSLRDLPEPSRSGMLDMLGQAARFDPATDQRTAAEKQLDQFALMLRSPDFTDHFSTEWLAWCTTCGRPALRPGAPRHDFLALALRRMGAADVTGSGLCVACESRATTRNVDAASSSREPTSA